jgi:hypothetical protein
METALTFLQSQSSRDKNAYVQYIKGSHKEKCLQDIYLNAIH